MVSTEAVKKQKKVAAGDQKSMSLQKVLPLESVSLARVQQSLHTQVGKIEVTENVCLEKVLIIATQSCGENYHIFMVKPEGAGIFTIKEEMVLDTFMDEFSNILQRNLNAQSAAK